MWARFGLQLKLRTVRVSHCSHCDYHANLIDEVIQVSKEEAFEFTRNVAKLEGILVGISTGASLAAVAKKAATLPDDAVVLTFNYDTGERYLSIEGLF